VDVKEIREIAGKYTPEQIEGCIAQQLETGRNVCLKNPSAEHIISELSKAEFIKRRIAEGMELADAIRELAKRMRDIQKGG